MHPWGYDKDVRKKNNCILSTRRGLWTATWCKQYVATWWAKSRESYRRIASESYRCDTYNLARLFIFVEATFCLARLFLKNFKRCFSANKGLSLPLGHRVCETKSKNGLSRPRKPYISWVSVLRGGLRDGARVIAKSRARVIAAIRITSVRWRSYLP